jgi:thiol-disulfide isomerase/thioredoxin
MKRSVLPVVILVGLTVATVVLVEDTPVRRWLRSVSAELAGAAGFAFSPVLKRHAEPRALADLRFQGRRGEVHSLSDHRGQVVLLNVWATWCPPCREEMPALQRLHQQLDGPAFQVIPLSVDLNGISSAKSFYRAVGLKSLRIFWAPYDETVRSLGIVGLPTTLLIDADGREIARTVGPAPWDDERAIADIRRLAGASAGTGSAKP